MSDLDSSGLTATCANKLLCWEGEDADEWDVEIWDTAGQESMVQLRAASYPGTNVFWLAYDMTVRESLENIMDEWIPEILEWCAASTFKAILVGCKHDEWAHRLENADIRGCVTLDAIREVCCAVFISVSE